MVGISEQALRTSKMVLGKCAANDPWFPTPNESMVLAWAEHFAITNLDRSDLLAGVTSVYAGNHAGFRPLPGDILAAARSIRSDRSHRTEPPIHHKAEIPPHEPVDEPKIPARHSHPKPPVNDPHRPVQEPETHAVATAEQRRAAINAFAASRGLPYIEEDAHRATDVQCPFCGALPAYPCTIHGTAQKLAKSKVHPARIQAAKQPFRR